MKMLATFRATARPFTSVRPAARVPVCIRRVVARAAAEEQDAVAQVVENEPTVTDEELSQLLEEEDDDLEAMYATEVVDEAVDEDEYVADDDDEAVIQAALEAVELMKEDVDDLTAVMVAAELDTDADKAAAEDRLAEMLQEGDAISDEGLQTILAGVPEAELTEILLEDEVPGMKSDRYEERALTADDMEAIAPYKLSKSELRKLLPADWDQIEYDYFSNKKSENIPLPEFRLNLLWNVSTLGVAIDQVYSRGQVSPLTAYHFWPRQDAWEELRQALEARPWISERDRIVLLNRLTGVINYWQEGEQKPPIEEARREFPDCVFIVA